MCVDGRQIGDQWIRKTNDKLMRLCDHPAVQVARTQNMECLGLVPRLPEERPKSKFWMMA